MENKISNKRKKELLMNRIIINYGIAIIAYIVLYYLLNKFYMRPSIVLPLAVIMFIAAVVCYIYNKKDGKTKNYGHMFLVFGILLLITNSSFIFATVFGRDAFFALKKISLFDKLFNSQKTVIGISILGIVYLVIMTVVNVVKIMAVGKKK